MRVNFRRRCEIKQPVTSKFSLAIEPLQPLSEFLVRFRIVVISVKILQMLEKFQTPVPARIVVVHVRQKLAGRLAERVVGHWRAREPQQTKSRRKTGMQRQIVQRRQKFAPRQVARSAEHHDGTRIVGNLAVIRISLGRFGDFGGIAAHGRAPRDLLRKPRPKEAERKTFPDANCPASDQPTILRTVSC